MNHIEGSIIKASETFLLFPFHHIIHRKQLGLINNNLTFSNLYKGISFQLVSSSINRGLDIWLFQNSNSILEASLYSSLCKTITYPLHTTEIYYQINNKIPKLNKLYNGFPIYTLTNIASFNIWINSLKIYDSILPYESDVKQKQFLVGFLSGLTTDVIVHPLKVIKTNLQNNTFKYNQLLNIPFYYRGMHYKILLSGFQTAYFNMFCNFVNKNDSNT